MEQDPLKSGDFDLLMNNQQNELLSGLLKKQESYPALCSLGMDTCSLCIYLHKQRFTLWKREIRSQLHSRKRGTGYLIII